MTGNRCWVAPYYRTRRKYVLQMSYFSPICYNENGQTNTWIAITNNKYCISIMAWDLSRSYWKKWEKFSPIRQMLSWLGYYVCCCMRIFPRNIKKIIRHILRIWNLNIKKIYVKITQSKIKIKIDLIGEILCKHELIL